jgi:PAS domain-containing protein
VDTGIVGHTFTSQRCFSIENAKMDPRFYSGVDQLSKNETNSLLSYPIIINQDRDHPPALSPARVVGVVQALNKQNGSGFTERDAQHMDELCTRVADVLSARMSNGKVAVSPPQSTLADIMRSLSEFASLLNRMEEKNYMKNLLRGVACYGTTISECDEIAVFSIATLQSENHRLGLQLVSEDPTGPDQAAAPLARLISSSTAHTALVLDILKTKQIRLASLSLSPVEVDQVGAPQLAILVLPVAYNSNPQLSSHLSGRSVDVIVAIKKKGGSQAGAFSPSHVEGLTALVRLLPPSLTLYGQILDEEASVAKLQSNQIIMSSTLSRLGLMVFVVSSTGEVVMHTPSWQRFLGVPESDLKVLTLSDLLGDRSPGFMADIKECIRSHSPREAKNCKIFSASYPKGISVNYDIHELKDSLLTTSAAQGATTASLFRVIISVLSSGDFSLDDSPLAENFLAPIQAIDRQAKNAETTFKMKSSLDAHALRSPRQFSPSDAAEVERLFTWEFNVLSIVDPAARRYCIVALLEKDLNLATLNISRNQLAAFVAEVEKNYRLNPFHNFFHAVGVTHFISMLMRDTQARIHINNDLMYFSMMSSAVVHDVDHPGNTNLFEINSGSELALLYNDIGVLENHHCSTAFRIMRLPGLDIFGQLNLAQKTLARKTIISCIMATDMALHVGLVEQMAARTGQPWIIDTPAEKLFYGKIILHSADLSNPVRPFYLSKEWACRVSEEFNRQGEMEKARGLPVSTFLLTPDTKTLAKNEIYFSGQVVAPMWRSLASLFPTLQHLATQIESNVESWKELLASLE